MSLHQQVLQGAQTQHRALRWLLKICANLALVVSKLLPHSSQQAPSADDAAQAAPVSRGVLLGTLLGTLDGCTQQLIFSVEYCAQSTSQAFAKDGERRVVELHSCC